MSRHNHHLALQLGSIVQYNAAVQENPITESANVILVLEGIKD